MAHSTWTANTIASLCNFIDSSNLSDTDVIIETPSFEKMWITVNVANSGSNSITGAGFSVYGKASNLDKWPLPVGTVLGTNATASDNIVWFADGHSASSATFVLEKLPPIVILTFSISSLPSTFNGSYIRGTACYR